MNEAGKESVREKEETLDRSGKTNRKEEEEERKRKGKEKKKKREIKKVVEAKD